MNLPLDTHAWLWFHLGGPHLSQTAKQHILDPANTKFVSPASLWEISIKISLGKYVLNIPYAQFMHDSIVGHGFQFLDISPQHTQLVSTLPFLVIDGKEHRDPFDRLLISQAITDGMSIVSDDGKFPSYAVPVIW
jgi:PIN domain nuclease of toxin-antitoxin system